MTTLTKDREPRACALIALAALALRLALVARPLVVLDRLFVPDDAYYTLAIARSIARGLGPSADGVHLTSGFQPFIAFLLVPIFRASGDADVAFRAALVVGAVADAVSVWLLGALTFRFGAPYARGKEAVRALRIAAVMASSIWALSPSAIATSLNGLETSLAMSCVLCALSAWSTARERGSIVAWFGVGIWLGLCLFARVDTVFFVAAIGVATLLRSGPRAVAAAIGGALLAIGPWWGYALSRFGTIVPESGASVREQTLVYTARGMNVRDYVAWASGAVVGPPLFDWAWLRQALGSGASALGLAVGIALVVALIGVVRGSWRRFGAQPDELRVLAMYAVCIYVFYALYLPATWFFRRYLAPVHLVTALVIPLVVGRAWEERRARPRMLVAVVTALSVCLVAALISIARFATSSPLSTIDQGHHGAKGYREPARQILALTPPGAVIGSFQSGALEWIADGSGTQVVNLDGVVDREAARAFRHHEIARFARSRGVTHLADWEANVRLFLDRSGDPNMGRSALRLIGEAESQGEDERFGLYAIDWANDVLPPRGR